MKLGILLLVTGGKALKDNSEFEQSGAIAEDIFITEGKSLNPTTTQSFETPNQKSYNDQNLSWNVQFKNQVQYQYRKSCIRLTTHLYKYLTINTQGSRELVRSKESRRYRPYTISDAG